MCLPGSTCAQNPIRLDTIPYTSGIQAGMDIWHLIRGWLPGSPLQRSEGIVEYYTKRWIASLEAGTERYNSAQGDQVVSQYQKYGYYARLGVGFNVLHHTLYRGEMLRLSLVYAQSRFREALQGNLQSEVFDQIPLNLEQQLRASWWEMALALRIRAWQYLSMGFTTRYQLGLRVRGNEAFSNYQVSGYGRSDKNRFGFAYQLLLRIPFKER